MDWYSLCAPNAGLKFTVTFSIEVLNGKVLVFFPLQTELHDGLTPHLPAAREPTPSSGTTVLGQAHPAAGTAAQTSCMGTPAKEALAAMHRCQGSSLQPCIPVRDHPCSHASPRARPVRAVLRWRRALLSSSSPEQTFMAAASRAGQAGCRAGPVCGGSAAVGAGSSSRGSAEERGAAGKCAAEEPRAPARDPASVGRHKWGQSELPHHPAAPLLLQG